MEKTGEKDNNFKYLTKKNMTNFLLSIHMQHENFLKNMK